MVGLRLTALLPDLPESRCITQTCNVSLDIGKAMVVIDNSDALTAIRTFLYSKEAVHGTKSVRCLTYQFVQCVTLCDQIGFTLKYLWRLIRKWWSIFMPIHQYTKCKMHVTYLETAMHLNSQSIPFGKKNQPLKKLHRQEIHQHQAVLPVLCSLLHLLILQESWLAMDILCW